MFGRMEEQLPILAESKTALPGIPEIQLEGEEFSRGIPTSSAEKEHQRETLMEGITMRQNIPKIILFISVIDLLLVSNVVIHCLRSGGI